MAKLRYSEAALQDLEQIDDYISETLNNPTAALNTVNKIQDAVDKLVDFPFIGSPLSSIANMETDYRFLVCGNYLVFHRSETRVVYIDRVLYGKRDYMAILFGDTLEERLTENKQE
ncbi:MAG: type II toxin-antitoxin system RelE/ParE family toxin [Clostridiales bacterium]|nr:type II toxin-antitoxin system RelE/ParE family toxin [Clostridiales bacterium]